MARNKNPLPLFEHVTITDVAAEGKAIAKVNDMVIFVPLVAPGDVVDLQLTRKKNSYAEAKAVKFHTLSPDRVEPVCHHFGVCGGCKWQHLSYQKQLFHKEQQVMNALKRIGKIELPEIESIRGAEKTEYYRNKLEFTFSNKRWLTEEEIGSQKAFTQMNALGFHMPGLFDKVLDIDKCRLQSPLSNKIRIAIKNFCLENNYPFFDLRNQEGLMRNLIIRSTSTSETMVIVVFYRNDTEQIDRLMTHIAGKFPQITSLLYIVNQKANDTITDQTVHTYKGKDHIIEEMEGLKFKIGPKSFYQTNNEQAYVLYRVAREFAKLAGNELVYDLYTGTGTIANFIARNTRKVIGIEYLPEAIEDAKINSSLNGLENLLFFAGDMKDILTPDFITQHGRPDVVITDPPRAGMHANVIRSILFAAPQRIVYVSCNPSTQARDLQLLDEQYCVERVQPVDMFPHTHHVENVVLLTKRASGSKLEVF